MHCGTTRQSVARDVESAMASSRPRSATRPILAHRHPPCQRHSSSGAFCAGRTACCQGHTRLAWAGLRLAHDGRPCAGIRGLGRSTADLSRGRAAAASSCRRRLCSISGRAVAAVHFHNRRVHRRNGRRKHLYSSKWRRFRSRSAAHRTGSARSSARGAPPPLAPPAAWAPRRQPRWHAARDPAHGCLRPAAVWRRRAR